MAYTIYLDIDENFQCEAKIKNASYKNSKARLIVKNEDVSLIFEGKVDKESINIPIKSSVVNKLFEETDDATATLEVIVESTVVEPWTSEVKFDKYNKIEISEVKNVVTSSPIVEVSMPKKENVISENSVEDSKPVEKVSKKSESVIRENNRVSKPTEKISLEDSKQKLDLNKKFIIEQFNEYVKKANINITKEDQIKILKKLIYKIL